jgi:hypothetical protein
MGRALFSQAYALPTVRSEPEPSADPYEKWSRWNAFDPDSDEFFDNAQREVFLDTEEYMRDQERLSSLVEGTGSPVSSESSASEAGSPMAVGSDDPVVMMADAYAAASVDWEHRFLLAGAGEIEWRRNNNRDELERHEMIGYPRVTSLFNPRAPRNVATEGGEQVRPIRVNRPRSATITVPAVHPPSSLRNSTTATEIDDEFVVLPAHRLSSPLRRTVNITPINIPIEPSTPSPISSESPSTPPDTPYSRQIQHVFTPSPPPTVTPRIYTWNHHATPASPPSPTVARSMGGPLTNPNARMSLARISITPARVRVPNAVV